MPAPAFVDRLTEQVANEFAASQQYVAIAVHYDAETLPRLAAFFYRQAVEERNHALMMVQYLLDADAEVAIPAATAPIRPRRRSPAARCEPRAGGPSAAGGPQLRPSRDAAARRRAALGRGMD